MKSSHEVLITPFVLDRKNIYQESLLNFVMCIELKPHELSLFTPNLRNSFVSSPKNVF